MSYIVKNLIQERPYKYISITSFMYLHLLVVVVIIVCLLLPDCTGFSCSGSSSGGQTSERKQDRDQMREISEWIVYLI